MGELHNKLEIERNAFAAIKDKMIAKGWMPCHKSFIKGYKRAYFHYNKMIIHFTNFAPVGNYWHSYHTIKIKGGKIK